MFNSIDQLKKLINDYTQGVEVKASSKPAASETESLPNANSNDETPKLPLSIIKSDVFVIQKYIERPLLIKERKFDIRMWVLVTHEHKCYCFKEGYIRMSSYKYTLESDAFENLFVHLTNNAI